MILLSVIKSSYLSLFLEGSCIGALFLIESRFIGGYFELSVVDVCDNLVLASILLGSILYLDLSRALDELL
jgi:hypothetical protein